MKKNMWISLSLLTAMVVAFSVTCRVFGSSFAEAIIDWFAFLVGIFLVTEGLYKIFTEKTPSILNQLSRAFRVVIGTCVFTIHLLQFMR